MQNVLWIFLLFIISIPSIFVVGMANQLERVRLDLPGLNLENGVIHFNNAGASPMPSPVLQRFKDVLDLEQQIGAYAAADVYRADFEQTRVLAGQLVNAGDPEKEMALVDSATTAWMRAFYSIRLKQGDVILTCEAEYAANYVAMLQQCKKHGASIEVVPSRAEDGTVDVSALEAILSGPLGPRVRAVCITHVPSNGGLVNPAQEIGRAINHSYSGTTPPIYLLDACQSVGQLPVDVQAIQCDYLSATGRKYLRGPRGTGFLYARRDVLDEVSQPGGRIVEPPSIDHFAAPWVDSETYALSSTARRFEQWESNYAGLVALGVALEYALNMDIKGWAWPRIASLAAALRRRLESISPRTRVYDLGSESDGSQCGIVTFSIDGVAPAAIKKHLIENRMYVAVSPPSSTLLDSRRRGLSDDGLLRASVSYFNTEEEINKFVNCLAKLL